MIRAFEALAPTSEPFDLGPGLCVIQPEHFHRSLAEDVKHGPGGPRARTGAFQRDLEGYLKVRGVTT